LAKKDDVKVPNLAAENIQALEEFQTRLFNILEKHVNTPRLLYTIRFDCLANKMIKGYFYRR
jgi:hypothetical protein